MKRVHSWTTFKVLERNIHDKNDSQISEQLLFDVSSNNDASNTYILNATIKYILATKMSSYLLLSHLNNSQFSNTTDSIQQ